MTTLYISPGELSRKSAETEGKNDYNDDDQDDGRSISPFLLPSFLPSAHDHPFISLIWPPRETKWGDFENGNGSLPFSFLKKKEGKREKNSCIPCSEARTTAVIRSRPSMQNCEESGKKEACQKGRKLQSFSPWHMNYCRY